MDLPSFAGSPSDTSADAAVPVQDGPKQHFYQSPSHIYMSTPDPRIQNDFVDIPLADNTQQNPTTVVGNKMGRTASMQRVAGLENLQKRIRGGANSRGTHGSGE